MKDLDLRGKRISTHSVKQVIRRNKTSAFLCFVVALAVFVPFHVYSQPAAVASAHPLATEAGIEVMQKGGNAFDAAIAVTTTLAVVEPYSSGIGGGGFWLLHIQQDNRDVMIDGRERAPLAATRNMYLDEDGKVIPGASIDGPLSAGIPGVPAAIEHLALKGRRDPFGALEIKDGCSLTAHQRRLIAGGEIPVGKVFLSAGRNGAAVEQHVARQVLVLAAQAVGDPRAQAG